MNTVFEEHDELTSSIVDIRIAYNIAFENMNKLLEKCNTLLDKENLRKEILLSIQALENIGSKIDDAMMTVVNIEPC